MGAVGALAPTVFLPRPEIIHISVPLFLPRPEVVLILAPMLFSPVRRQCIYYSLLYNYELNLNPFLTNFYYYCYLIFEITIILKMILNCIFFLQQS